jgi:hypothetical protein
LYQVNAYAAFGAFGPPGNVPPLSDPVQLLEVGHYRLFDADGAAAELARIVDGAPVVDWFGWTLFPGEPLDSAAERIEYTARHVRPALQSRGVTAPAP